jgi:hypothetical protein
LVNSLHTARIVEHKKQPLATTVNISGKVARGWAISSMKAAPTIRLITPNPKTNLEPADVERLEEMIRQANLPAA